MPLDYRTAHPFLDISYAQNPFDDEGSSVKADNFIDQSSMDSSLELSPQMADSRRESLAVGPPLFSPKTEDWQSVDMQSVPSNNPFTEPPSHDAFLRQNETQVSTAFGRHSWPIHHASAAGSENVLQYFDDMTTYDPRAALFPRPFQDPASLANPCNIFGSLGSDDQSVPSTPQKDWVAAQQAGKKMRPGSPAIRSFNDLRRGDGIRKKNARFEIPPERNLTNIDQIIAQSTDEQEIKELKQQKRLLRNRQAALDSRQRKKQHTERLESEKKHFTAIISEMEDEMASLRLKVDRLIHEKQEYLHCIDGLTMEKDEMIRSHTIETGELRKKVGILTDHIHTMSPGVGVQSTVPGSYDQMDGLTMNPIWEPPNFFNDYAVEPVPVPVPEAQLKQEMSVVSASKHENSFNNPAQGEKAATQGGLLFMLFLVGAFVLSNRSTPSIPPVSEDVRIASATLLDNVLKDAGVDSAPNSVRLPAPPASSTNWPDSVPSMPAHDMSIDGVGPSLLTELGHPITQPSQQQTTEQVFSLSAAQYNGIGDSEFLQSRQQERSTGQGRKNLAESLAALRATNKQTGVAEVYTRSLLFDQIPSEVVRHFAKMFAECNAQPEKQRCNEAR